MLGQQTETMAGRCYRENGAIVGKAHAHLLVRSLPRRRKDETHGDADFGQHQTVWHSLRLGSGRQD